MGRTHKLIFATRNVGNIHVVGGWAQIFEFLASEDIDGDEMNLSMTMLASLGSRHVNNLAGTAFDDDVSVLPQGRALHGIGSRGTGIGGVEGVFMLNPTKNDVSAKEQVQ